MDWRSFLHNDELNVVVLGREFGRQMDAAFENDLAQSRRITAEAWAERPLSSRILERVARLWEYWL
jgi:cardiolipin synthase